MRHSISRKAILIGCPGSGNSFLRGVAEDLTNMENFLQSDKGGRWFPNEIVTLTNPNFEKVFSVVHSTRADYNFIYFSGHGFTSYDNSRMLALRDNNIADLFFINDSPRQLIVVDACRNYVAPGISGIPDLGEEWFHFPQVLQKQGNSQVPCITYTEGNLIVPFAIAVPQTSQPKPISIPQRQFATANNNSSGAGLALFGLGFLLLIAAAE